MFGKTLINFKTLLWLNKHLNPRHFRKNHGHHYQSQWEDMSGRHDRWDSDVESQGVFFFNARRHINDFRFFWWRFREYVCLFSHALLAPVGSYVAHGSSISSLSAQDIPAKSLEGVEIHYLPLRCSWNPVSHSFPGSDQLSNRKVKQESLIPIKCVHR